MANRASSILQILFLVAGFWMAAASPSSAVEFGTGQGAIDGNSDEPGEKLYLTYNINTYDFADGPGGLYPEAGQSVFDCDDYVYTYFEAGDLTNSNDRAILDCTYFVQYSQDGGETWSNHYVYDNYYTGPWAPSIWMTSWFRLDDSVCSMSSCAGYVWRVRLRAEDVYGGQTLYAESPEFIFLDVLDPVAYPPEALVDPTVEYLEGNGSLPVMLTATDSGDLVGIQLRYQIDGGDYVYLPGPSDVFPVEGTIDTVYTQVPIPSPYAGREIALRSYAFDCAGNSDASATRYYTVAEEAAEVVDTFLENWEGGMDAWLVWGTPAPVIVDGSGMQGGRALNPNGDGFCESGLLAADAVRWDPGSLLEFDYLLNATREPRPEHYSLLSVGLARRNLAVEGICAGEAPDTDLAIYLFDEQVSPDHFVSMRGQGQLLAFPSRWTDSGNWHHFTMHAIGGESGSVERLRLLHDAEIFEIELPDTLANTGHLYVAGRSLSTLNLVDNLSLRSEQAFSEVVTCESTAVGTSSRTGLTLTNRLERDVVVSGDVQQSGNVVFSQSFADSLNAGILIGARSEVATSIEFVPTEPGPVEFMVALYDTSTGASTGSVRIFGEGVRTQPENLYIYENWEDGLHRWYGWGAPRPIVVEETGYRGGAAIDPNGDGWCTSGLWSRQMFSWRPGVQIEYLYMTNARLDSRQQYHQSVSMALTSGEPKVDDLYCSYDGIATMMSLSTTPNLSGETRSVSVSGLETLLSEEYPATEDGLWHHVRIHAIGEPGQEVDSLAVTLDARRFVWDIRGASVPDSVAIAFRGRSVGMINCFDNVRVGMEPGIHGSLVLGENSTPGYYIATLTNRSDRVRTIQLYGDLIAPFYFTEGFADSISTGFDVGPGESFPVGIVYIPAEGQSSQQLVEFRDPQTGDYTGSLFLSGQSTPISLAWQNEDEIGDVPLRRDEPQTIEMINTSPVAVDSVRIIVESPGVNSRWYLMQEAEDGEPLYQFQIPDEMIGATGLRWRVAPYVGGFRATTDEPWHYMRVALDSTDVAIEVPDRRYELISVPADPGDANFVDQLRDDLGAFDREKWRMFRYDPSSSRYFEQGDGAYFGMHQGSAYWLIVDGTQVVDLDSGECLSTPADVPFEVELAPGWNMIGNPFAFPVSWSAVSVGDSVMSEQSTVSLPTWWDSSRAEYVTSRDLLQPFEGCWVRNYSSSPVVVSLPPAPANQAEVKSPGQVCVSPDSWILNLSASCGESRDSNNRLGVTANARTGWDVADTPEPPAAPGDRSLRLAFLPRTGWGVYECPYSADIRSLPSTSQTAGENTQYWWFFDVGKNFADDGVADQVDIRIAGIGEIPEGQIVILYDRELQRFWNPNEGDRYSFNLGRHEMATTADAARFALFVGPNQGFESGYVDDDRIPAFTGIRSCYPNPFNPSVLVRYSLSRAMHAKLEIFDLAGRRVKVLEDGVQEEGIHEALWTGQDGNGRRVAAGAYFCRLSAEDGTGQTWKIMMLK